jgi:MFS family permease
MMALLTILQDNLSLNDLFIFFFTISLSLIVLIFDSIYGIYIISKSKKTNAKLLLPLGMLIFFIGLQNLSSQGVLPLISILWILAGIYATNFLLFLEILSLIIIPVFIIILSFYLSVKLLFPERRRNRFLGTLIIIIISVAIVIIHLIASLKSHLYSVRYFHFYLFLIYISNLCLAFFSLSFLGFGFLYKFFKAKGLLKKKFLFLSIGFLLFAIFQFFRWISHTINYYFMKNIYYWDILLNLVSLTTLISSMLSYLGLKEVIETKIPMRLNLLVEEGLFRISQMKPVETTEEADEIEPEYPVLLAIMSKAGYVVFTNPFSVDISFDEKRLGEFVSFYNSISDQIFSQSLDRAKFGDYTIILKVLDYITFCYLFEGRSFLPKLRLNHFCEAVKRNKIISETLMKAVYAGRTITLEDNPELETLIAENFLSDPQKFQNTQELDELHQLVKKSRKVRKRFVSRWKRISRTMKSEIMVQVTSLLLYLTSHLLWVAHIYEVEIRGIILGITDVLPYIIITLILAIGCHLIVLAILIVKWQSTTRKTQFAGKEILIQIVGLVLLITAHCFYLSYGDVTNQLGWTVDQYMLVINLALFPGFGCQLLVIYLIIDDYTKKYS